MTTHKSMVNNCIKFTYLYRDSGNYKFWNSIIFANPDKLALDEIEQRLKQSFDDDLFIASQINLPELFPYTAETYTEDDHCLHEFDSVESTDEQATDSHQRTIKDFIKQVETENSVGWQFFDPKISKSIAK